jgi:hypothetical protein
MVEIYCSDMSSESAPDPAPESGADSSVVEQTLMSLYREYVGKPDSERDVYAGFGLFFGGIALGAVGLVLFLYSGVQTPGSDFFWQLREIALVFAMLALPAVGLSIAVLLPVGRRTLAASLLGAGICVVGVVWLTQVYPYQWTGAGNDTTVLSVYAIGTVLLAASTGSALVAQYVDNVAPVENGEATGPEATATTASEGETVSDEQVDEDIEAAMSDSTLTWGGVDQSPTTKRLELDMPEETEIDTQDIESATETRSSGDSVDDAVSGLQNLQGGETEKARADSPDDQVDALTEFRRQQDADDGLETGVGDDSGALDRLREKLFE